MVVKTIENFSMEQICRSGQCFRMNEQEGIKGRYVIQAADRYLEAEQKENCSIFYCEEEEFESFWKPYFDLETQYSVYLNAVDESDRYLRTAAEFGSGIRILRQDLWEMVVTFLISQQNNIVRIRRCVQNICEAYGEVRVNAAGEKYYAFPKPEALAGLDEDALKACNLGYRSKYVVRTARAVVQGDIDIQKLDGMNYADAKKQLLKLYGVGEKVADCICLFGLHKLEAFPIDTHINQALEKYYAAGFPKARYQGFEGIIQQYIFYFELYGRKNIQDAEKINF